MRWRKVRVANGHLDVFVTGKLLYRSQIDPSHNETRDVCVSKDVPGNVLKRRILLYSFLHDQLKPGAGRDHWFAIAGEAHMGRSHAAALPQFFKGAYCRLSENHHAGRSVLGSQ